MKAICICSPNLFHSRGFHQSSEIILVCTVDIWCYTVMKTTCKTIAQYSLILEKTREELQTIIVQNVPIHNAVTIHKTSKKFNAKKYMALPATRKMFAIFTALHCMQRSPSHRNGVRLSVRLSVCHGVNCDKTKAPSEKSSIMTNRKSPTTLPMSLR